MVQLRRDRASFREIGAELGISPQAAWKAYQKALREVPVADVETLRLEELELVDFAINDLLKLALDHRKPRYSVESWNTICRWSERRARLMGLDAPARKAIEVLTQDVIDKEIERLAVELAEAGGDVPPI